MGWFERAMSRLGYAKAMNPTEFAQLISTALTASPTGVAPEKPYSALVDAYKSWVYTCIDKIAKTVAIMPLKLYIYRRDGQKLVLPQAIKAELKSLNSQSERAYAMKDLGLIREQVLEHPFLQLQNRPNQIMTRMSLWYETVTRMELSGLCGWYCPSNRLGVPGEIWPLPLTKTSMLTAKVNTRAQIEYWIYRDGQIIERLDPKHVVPLKYPNPANPWKGFSPLMAQTYPYDIDLYMMQQQRALYENMAVPGINLHTDQALTPAQVKEMKEYLNENYAGATKAGQPLITHSGLQASRTGMTPKEALLKDVAKWAREKLITSFDLSEGKLGLVADVNRANIEALNDTFITECLKPKTMLIEEAVEAFLLPKYDQGLTCDFDLPDIKNRELDIREREVNLKNFVTVINEEREKDGLDPVPWGDRPWIPMTMIQDGGGGTLKGTGRDQGEEDFGDALEEKAISDNGRLAGKKNSGIGSFSWPGRHVGNE